MLTGSICGARRSRRDTVSIHGISADEDLNGYGLDMPFGLQVHEVFGREGSQPDLRVQVEQAHVARRWPRERGHFVDTLTAIMKR